MSILFTQIQDCFVIIRKGGVEYQRCVYQRKKRLYIQHGAGFIGMHNNGVTTVPSIRWIDAFDLPKHTEEPLGRLYIK